MQARPMQVEFVARLANSLGVELVKTEALRAMRERPNNPDPVDLSMRGWVERYRGQASRTNEDAAIGLFERALALDPSNEYAATGLGGDYGRHGEFDKSVEYFDKAILESLYDPLLAHLYGGGRGPISG